MDCRAEAGKHEPQRQCIGCGRRGPQAEFLRLTLNREEAPPRVVPVTGAQHEGRGAYLCRRRACLEKAIHRKAFQRAFRATVTVDAEGIGEVLIVDGADTAPEKDMAGGG